MHFYNEINEIASKKGFNNYIEYIRSYTNIII